MKLKGALVLEISFSIIGIQTRTITKLNINSFQGNNSIVCLLKK